MERRKIVAFVNVILFGLFITAFIMKMLLVAFIFLIIHSVVFVFTVQS